MFPQDRKLKYTEVQKSLGLTRAQYEWFRGVINYEWPGDDDGLPIMLRSFFTESRNIFIVSPTVFSDQPEIIAELAAGQDSAWCLAKDGETYLVISHSDLARSRSIFNKLYGYLLNRRRRARLRALDGFHLPEHIRMLWDIQEGRCYFSNEMFGPRFETASFQVDHLWPVATKNHRPAFGTNWPINLALVTESVNRSKGNDDAATFLVIVKRTKKFISRSSAERRAIDKLKLKAFGPFMTKHCSQDPTIWGPGV